MHPSNMRRPRKSFRNRYQQTLDDLRSRILSGELKCGEPLASEIDLAQRYEMSRGSLRKVLSALEAEGLVEKVPGKGNFVTGLRPAAPACTLKVGLFTSNQDMANMLLLLEQFERANPSVTVQPVRIAVEHYVSTIRDLSVDEAGVDLFMLSDYQFREFQASRELVNLSEALGSAWRPSAFYPQAVRAFEQDGANFAVPFDFSPVVLAYNQDLFDAAGMKYPTADWSWEQFIAAAANLTPDGKPGEVARQFGFCFTNHRNRWPIFLMQNQASLANSKGFPTLTDQRVVEAVSFCTDMMYRHRVTPVHLHSREGGEVLFAQGRIGMVLTTYFAMNEFRHLPFRWAVAPPFHGGSPASILVAMGLAVHKRSPRIEQALDLVRFLTSERAQTFLKENSTSLPALQSVGGRTSLERMGLHPPGYRCFSEVLPYTRSLNTLGDSLLSILGRELELTWINLELPADGCARAQRRALEMLRVV